MERDLEGKRALVTGGGSGMGRSIAVSLAQAGCRVAVCGRRQSRLQETIAAGPEGAIIYRVCDVSDREAVKELFAWVGIELGEIDFLVNSAGVNVRNRAMAEISPEDWDHVLAVNATGAFNCTHAVLPQMRRRGDGVIIHINSIAGKRASLLGGVAYSAAKFAMTALGTCVSLEDGKNGIRVTNVFPGEVDTPILDDRPVPVTDEHKARILKAQDVADAVMMVVRLPPRAHVPELVIKPTLQDYA